MILDKALSKKEMGTEKRERNENPNGFVRSTKGLKSRRRGTHKSRRNVNTPGTDDDDFSSSSSLQNLTTTTRKSREKRWWDQKSAKSKKIRNKNKEKSNRRRIYQSCAPCDGCCASFFWVKRCENRSYRSEGRGRSSNNHLLLHFQFPWKRIKSDWSSRLNVTRCWIFHWISSPLFNWLTSMDVEILFLL